MKKKILIFFTVIGGVVSWFIYPFIMSGSNILISDSIEEFFTNIDIYLKNNIKMIVLFDLDDTVFVSKQMMGTPDWYYANVNKLRNHGFSKKDSYVFMSKIDYFIQQNIDVVLTEDLVKEKMLQLKSKGVSVFAITSRSREFIPIVHKQISSLNIDFTNDINDCIASKWTDNVGLFSDGIIFVGFASNKDVASQKFLKIIKTCLPDVNLIAFIDDQQRYVQDIEKNSQLLGFKYFGFIYNGALVGRDLDIEQGNAQLFMLEKNLESNIIGNEYRYVFSH